MSAHGGRTGLGAGPALLDDQPAQGLHGERRCAAGAVACSNRCTFALGGDPLTGRNGCGMADNGHNVTMPARLGA
jgi:hypothetical protein